MRHGKEKNGALFFFRGRPPLPFWLSLSCLPRARPAGPAPAPSLPTHVTRTFAGLESGGGSRIGGEVPGWRRGEQAGNRQAGASERKMADRLPAPAPAATRARPAPDTLDRPAGPPKASNRPAHAKQMGADVAGRRGAPIRRAAGRREKKRRCAASGPSSWRGVKWPAAREGGPPRTPLPSPPPARPPHSRTCLARPGPVGGRSALRGRCAVVARGEPEEMGERAANADGADVESVYPVKKRPAHFFFFRARERPSGCGRAIGRGMGACADRACKQKCATLLAHASGLCAARLGRERGVGGCGRARALAATPTPFCPPCRARPARPPARPPTHTHTPIVDLHTHTHQTQPTSPKQRET